MSKSVVLRFGPFQADGRTGELRNNGILVKLPPQAFQILVLLAEHPDELVTREQIQLTLWPHGTVVNWEHSINTAVKRIRIALRDSRAEPRYIETLSRRGYRFIGSVERVEIAERQQASEIAPVAEEPSSRSWNFGNSDHRIISHYRVLREIGRGGMGVVFEAEDIRLGRRLALKFLAPDLESDADAVARFEREARMACVLSHPNICTIFEVGKAEQTPFLAMEFLDGQTLQQLIAAATPGSPLSTSVVLDVAIAVADALEGAHSHGVIHRDIKPSNIFLTRSSGVKVLDFGLAKPALRRTGNSKSADLDELTSAGVAVGTFAYMSPEQRRAEEIDGRSDLYSLGCVLYEATTGRSFDYRFVQGFAGADFASKHPRRLSEIVERLIDPDPNLRYQTAGDLGSDLRRLRRDLSSAQNAQVAPAVLPTRPRWRGMKVGIAIAGCVTAVIGSLYVLRGRNTSPGPFSIQPLTGLSEHENSPAFSPDGKLIAYSSYSESQPSHIYIKMIGGGPPLALTSGPEPDLSPAWSPDARSVAFVREGPISHVLVVPALGGVAREIDPVNPITVDAGSRAISWLPNSVDLLTSDHGSGVPAAIFQISSRTGAKRQLSHPAPDILGDGSPEVSPDGRQFAFLRWMRNSVSEIYIQALDAGEAHRLTFDGSRISSLAWMPDGRSIVFQSRRGALPGLWRISASGGQPQPLTGVGGDAGVVAISRTGNLLAYVYQIQNVELWKTAVPSPSEMGAPVMLAPSPREDVSGEYSPDGQRIVFSSDRSGAFEIWTCAADGTLPQQVTYFKGPITGTPHWSPDGRWILFDSRPSGHGSVFVVSRDGGQAREITKDQVDDIVPNWSRDGQWIYFSSNRGNGTEIYRIPAAGGAPVQVTRNGGFEAVESPDRQWLYYTKEGNANGIWRMPLAGGDEHLVLNRFVARFWTVTSSGLAYLDVFAKPRAMLTMIDLNTGRTSKLGPLKGRIVWGSSGFSLSPDGHWLLFPQIDRTVSEINVVENFQ